MSDNKSKRGQPDRAKIAAGEPYAIEYRARQLAPEFPHKTKDQIKRAILESARVPQFHNDAEMVLNSARLKLKNR